MTEHQHEMGLAAEWFHAMLRYEEDRKIIEGRKGTKKWLKINLGDVILITNSNNPDESFLFKVEGFMPPGKDVDEKWRPYGSIREYLEEVGLQNALPGKETLEEGVKEYEKFWTDPEEIRKYGVFGILGRPM